jgi:hypothetical protein
VSHCRPLTRAPSSFIDGILGLAHALCSRLLRAWKNQHRKARNGATFGRGWAVVVQYCAIFLMLPTESSADANCASDRKSFRHQIIRLREQNRVLDNALQFTDIPRPRITPEYRTTRRRNSTHGFLYFRVIRSKNVSLSNTRSSRRSRKGGTFIFTVLTRILRSVRAIAIVM